MGVLKFHVCCFQSLFISLLQHPSFTAKFQGRFSCNSVDFKFYFFIYLFSKMSRIIPLIFLYMSVPCLLYNVCSPMYCNLDVYDKFLFFVFRQHTLPCDKKLGF